ncbi:hypothetical protein MSPP1_003396 [Malassezia sp. CBS 17886]|nr:hypothetical protein MSPP1_003396 [Malassezia sp. CBS 17886]
MASSTRHRRVPASDTAQTAQAAEPISRSGPPRLHRLLWVLAISTFVFVAFQVWRLQSSYASLQQVKAWITPSSHNIMVEGLEELVEDGQDADGSLEMQFDEDGAIDLATMQRMLDVLYKGPNRKEGYENLDADEASYRYKKEKGGDGG